MVSSILEHTTQHGAIEGKTQTKETKDKKRKIAAAKKADEDDLKELEEMEKRLLENKKGKGTRHTDKV